VVTKRVLPLPPPLKPKPAQVKYVVVLYNFTAQAVGDLNFKVGHRIRVIEHTERAKD
jgi:amphiphysin